MIRYLSLLVWMGLLLLTACRPNELPTEPARPLTATPIPVPPETRRPVEPSPTPTSESPVHTSPLATPVPTPTSETSPLPTAAPERGEVGNADVLHVRAVQDADASAGSGQGGSWTFHVTVQHPDIGWEDYADGWDVLTLDGTVIKPDPDSPFTRLLLHPHVDEQPFIRSQSGILIPPDVTQVRVRAHDLVHGYGGREVVVDLTLASGSDFEVERKP